jgi:hypothetical protein
VVPSQTLNVDLNGSPEAPDGVAYETLLMAQTPQYEARARAVARVIAGRDILNICGELNTIVHHGYTYVGGLNQNEFGGAYYASALIHLLRGGADLEMRWVATANDDAYGLMTKNGEPTPACLAKQLFTQHVQYGDTVHFPGGRPDCPNVDAVVAHSVSGRRSGVFVHTAGGPITLTVSDWDGGLSACDTVLWIDKSTANRVNRKPFVGTIQLDGYGVAVVTNSTSDTALN